MLRFKFQFEILILKIWEPQFEIWNLEFEYFQNWQQKPGR